MENESDYCEVETEFLHTERHRNLEEFSIMWLEVFEAQ